jgi:hypothetical protein
VIDIPSALLESVGAGQGGWVRHGWTSSAGKPRRS